MILKKPDYEEVKRILIRTSFPRVLVVEPTSYCNLKCVFCPYPDLKRQKGKMRIDLFRKIVDEISVENPSTDLWIAFLGEPLTMGSEIIKFISYAKKKDLEKVHLNTNACLMSKQLADELLSSGVDDIAISLDAFKKETYDKIRIGGDFQKTRRNIEYLLEAKTLLKLEKPTINLQLIVTNLNEEEIDLFIDYWTERNAIVKIRPKLGWGNAIKTEMFSITENERTFPCPWSNRGFVILWDGKFAQCDADFEGKYSPGHIEENSIREVWNGELARRREKHWSLDFSHELCMECKDWASGRSLFFIKKKGRQ